MIRAATSCGPYCELRSVSGRLSNSHAQALQQASLALRMQQFAQAERLATEVLKANRTNPAAVGILSHALIGQGRGDEAIAPLERAARQKSDLQIETLLGAALCSAGRSADGIEQLRRVTARHPPFLP